MPFTRHICYGCRTPIHNVMVDGIRIPLVLCFWAGQPDDTGSALDVNAPGVALPSFIREAMSTPLAQAELCMVCVAKAFGVPLVTADEDPMQGAGAEVRLPTERGSMEEVERRSVLLERTLAALEVGRGELAPPAPGQYLRGHAEFEAYAPPPPLPPEPQAAEPDVEETASTASEQAAPEISDPSPPDPAGAVTPV